MAVTGPPGAAGGRAVAARRGRCPAPLRCIDGACSRYCKAGAALLLSAGAFWDRAGARRAFGTGTGLSVAASAGCGLAPGTGALVAARFVQGGAAAVIMPSSMALIGQAYPGSVERARAVAVRAMGGAIASSCGPVLGGC